MEETFPDILSWVLTCYGVEAELIFGDIVINSINGFHQGDPLASLLFALTLQPIVDMIQLTVPTLKTNEWYLDDGAVAGRREELQQVVDIILEHGPPRGLNLSTAATSSRPKSTVWCPYANVNTDPDPLDRGIPSIQEDGIVLLGSPIGSSDFERQAVDTRIDKVKELTDRLPLMQDAHCEYVLLRSCLSIPKVMFSLRTTDPLHHQPLWQRFDSIIRESLTRIIGVPLNDCQWLQAQLPVSKGGLGMRAAWDHAPAAYVTSVIFSQELKEGILGLGGDDCPPRISQPLLDYLAAKSGDEEMSVASLQGETQKTVSLKVDLHNLQLLNEHVSELGSVRDTARLAETNRVHSLSEVQAGM